MLVSGPNTEKFNKALSVLNQELKTLGKLNLNSQAVHAEDFFMGLLNMLYQWKLVNANNIRRNMKAIDLVDEEARILVQVTVTCTAEKVSKTLTDPIAQTYAANGYRMVFVFVGEQWEYIKRSKAVKNKYHVKFDQQQDLLLTVDLVERFKGLSPNRQYSVLRLVDAWTNGDSITLSVDGIVESRTIRLINTRLEQRKMHHPSFRLMGEVDEDLLPKGLVDVIPNSERSVKPYDEDPVLFKDFVRASWKPERQSHLFITGEGGVGKTVAMLTFATEDGFLPRNVAAVYIPLYELSQYCVGGADKDCIDRFIENDFPNKDLPKQIQRLAANDWHDGPSLILLMDGYNEIPNDCRRAVNSSIDKWATWPGVRVITTSRELTNTLYCLRYASWLHLMPLENTSIRAYLGSGASEIEDRLCEVICTPLMLRLYVSTKSFEGDNADYVHLERSDNPGHLIWNYLQRKLWRCIEHGGKYLPIEYAIAILLTLPYVCWKMASRSLFSIDEGKFGILVSEACSRWAHAVLPECLGRVEGDELGYLDDVRGFSPRRMADRQRAILEKETVLIASRKEAGHSVYFLLHQSFRDCLAALHVRNAIEPIPDTLPNELCEPLTPFVKDYFADLANDELLNRVWERNRTVFTFNVSAIHNLLGAIQRKGGEAFASLDFSGMDLSNISLISYRRGTELLLPKHPAHFVGTTLGLSCFSPNGHGGPVNSVSFSPDGSLIASGSDDGAVRLWDAATGAPVTAALSGHGGPVNSVSFSPDGSLIASGYSAGVVCLWTATSGVQIRRIDGHGGPVNSVSFSPDGSLIASGSDDGAARLWDVGSRRLLLCLEHGACGVASVCFSPDGALLATGSDDGAMRLWDAATGAPVTAALSGHGGPVNSVSFSPDGSLIASGSDDGAVRLWMFEADMASISILREIRDERWGYTHLNSVCFSPNGYSIAASVDKRYIRLWDVASGMEIGGFEGHAGMMTGRFSSICYAPDGHLLAGGSSDGTVRLWDVRTREYAIAPIWGRYKRVRNTSVCFSPDGCLLASGSSDGALHLWDSLTGVLTTAPIEGHRDCIVSICFSPDGTLLASSSKFGTVRLWYTTNGEIAVELQKGPRESIKSLCFSPDGHLLACGSDDGIIYIWNVSNLEHGVSLLKAWAFDDSFSRIDGISLDFSPDGRLLAIGSSNGIVRLWDVSDLEHGVPLLRTWDLGDGFFIHYISLDFSSSGQMIAIGIDGGILALETVTGNVITLSSGSSRHWATPVCFSSNGRMLAGGLDHDVRVWNMDDGSELSMHPDNHLVWDDGVSEGAGCAHIWDRGFGESIVHANDDQYRINSICFSPDGRTIAGGADDGVLRLWDVSSGCITRRIEPLYGVSVFGLDLSRAIVPEPDKRILRQNGAIFDV